MESIATNSNNVNTSQEDIVLKVLGGHPQDMLEERVVVPYPGANLRATLGGPWTLQKKFKLL
jgi:hypothetical protein